LVEQLYVAFADGRKWHNSRIVDDHIDAAELLHRLFEQSLDVALVRNIRFERNGIAANPSDFGNDAFSLPCIA
jgi:hypothetical protein